MSIDSQWHVKRRKQILEKYPQIVNYFGNYSLSVIPILAIVALQWLVAWLVCNLNLRWWEIGFVAFFIGQFLLHSLSTFIHEAAHSLIFKGKRGAIASLFLIELGTLSFGKSLSYIARHGPSHHMHLNNYEKDYEWWDKNKSEFLSSHVLLRGLQAFLHFFPGGPVVTDLIVNAIVPVDESRQIKKAKYSAKITALFIANTFILHVLAWYFIGLKACLYFLWSLSLMISNWGITFTGQAISEHHNYQQGKTYSTYHWSNIPFFNTGYHDEHHTFPDVPWIYLPKLKQIAPEYFTNDSPYSYFQWWGIWAKSIFAPDRYNRYSPSEQVIPVTSEQLPVTSEQLPVTSEQLPVTSKQ
jgi:sphingolipid 4-desaturase/C4-monooxygenase